jgi:predicted DNA-binding transcriptional regulator AlpA
MKDNAKTSNLRVLRGPQVYGPTGKAGKLRSQFYADIAAGTFPAGFMVSSTQRGWLEHEIDEWILARARNHPAGAPREQYCVRLYVEPLARGDDGDKIVVRYSYRL